MISSKPRHRMVLWIVSICLLTGCRPTTLPATSPPPAPSISVTDPTSIPTTAPITEATITTEIISTITPEPAEETSPSIEPTILETSPSAETHQSVNPSSTVPPPPETPQWETSSQETTSIETAPSPPPAPPAPLSAREQAQIAFDLQNQYLIQHQVTPLQWSDTLYQIAVSRIQDLRIDYSHEGCPDWVGENILRGAPSPEIAIQAWYDSDGHRRNMLAGWTYCAIAHDGTFWVAIFSMTETP